MDFTRDDITGTTGIRKKLRVKGFVEAALTDTEKGSIKDLTDKERDDERRRLVDVFPNMVPCVKDSIFDLRTLDQGSEGACTVACLMHLIHASGKDHLHPMTGRGARRKPKTWNKIKRS